MYPQLLDPCVWQESWLEHELSDYLSHIEALDLNPILTFTDV